MAVVALAGTHVGARKLVARGHNGGDVYRSILLQRYGLARSTNYSRRVGGERLEVGIHDPVLNTEERRSDQQASLRIEIAETAPPA